MKPRTIATIFSRLFDPPVVLSVVTILGLLQSGTSGAALTQTLLIIVFGMIGPPIVFLWLAVRTKRVGNWDITNRRERIVPLLFLFLLVVVDVYVVRWLGNTFLYNLFCMYAVWLLGFLLITMKWKISGHTGANMLGVLLLFSWYGYPALIAAISVPLVSWARIVRKDHTIFQVVAGILYSCLIMAIMAYF